MPLAELLRANWLLAIFGTVLYVAGIAIIFWNEVKLIKNKLF